MGVAHTSPYLESVKRLVGVLARKARKRRERLGLPGPVTIGLEREPSPEALRTFLERRKVKPEVIEKFEKEARADRPFFKAIEEHARNNLGLKVVYLEGLARHSDSIRRVLQVARIDEKLLDFDPKTPNAEREILQIYKELGQYKLERSYRNIALSPAADKIMIARAKKLGTDISVVGIIHAIAMNKTGRFRLYSIPEGAVNSEIDEANQKEVQEVLADRNIRRQARQQAIRERKAI